MKPFSALSRSGQHRRLKTLGRLALLNYQISEANLSFISETGNTIFRVQQPSAQSVLRIHTPEIRSTAAIADELTWLAALRAETSLIVPNPVATVDGDLVQTVTTPGVPEGRQVVLFHWLPGQLIDKRYNQALVEQLGRFMAQLHEHASCFSLPATSEREHDDWHGMADWRSQAPNGGALLTQEEYALCEKAAPLVANEIAQIDTRRQFGLIHSDLHFRNCLLYQGKLAVIDFDDCQFAPFSNDIAITLTDLDDSPDYEVLRGALLKGYQQVRPLPAERQVIDALMVERGLRLILWALSWPSVDYFSFGQAMVAQSLQRTWRYLKQYTDFSVGAMT